MELNSCSSSCRNNFLRIEVEKRRYAKVKTFLIINQHLFLELPCFVQCCRIVSSCVNISSSIFILIRLLLEPAYFSLYEASLIIVKNPPFPAIPVSLNFIPARHMKNTFPFIQFNFLIIIPIPDE